MSRSKNAAAAAADAAVRDLLLAELRHHVDRLPTGTLPALVGVVAAFRADPLHPPTVGTVRRWVDRLSAMRAWDRVARENPTWCGSKVIQAVVRELAAPGLRLSSTTIRRWRIAYVSPGGQAALVDHYGRCRKTG